MELQSTATYTTRNWQEASKNNIAFSTFQVIEANRIDNTGTIDNTSWIPTYALVTKTAQRRKDALRELGKY